MSHFLARLVDRARGSAPRVEPLIAPWFAPVDSLGAMPQLETKAEPARATPSDQVTAKAPNESNGSELPKVPPPPVKHETRITTERLLVPQFVERAAEARPPIHGRKENGMKTTPAIIPRVTANSPGERRSTVVVREIAHALTQNSKTPFEQSPDAPESSPTVRVTIGRIDVRAVQQPAPAPRKSRPSAGPALSLESYLDSRKKGAR